MFPMDHWSFTPLPSGVTTPPMFRDNFSTTTMTVNEQVEVLPVLSVAVYTTSLGPSRKVSPDLKGEETERSLQLSVAVGGSHSTVVTSEELVTVTSISSGQLIKVGAVLSLT